MASFFHRALCRWLCAPLFCCLAAALAAGCRSGRISTPLPSPLHPPTASPIRLVDRAAASGIRFHLGHDGRSPLNILETAGCGCAFLDFDGDGKLDVFLVGQPHCALYRNNGDGSFTDVTLQAGITATGVFMGVAVGDYDNDGRPDLFVTGYGKNVLYHNVGGRFQDVTAGSGLAARGPADWATSATFVDLDGDGKLDLAVGHYVHYTPRSIQFCSYDGVKAACPPYYYDEQKLSVFRGGGNGHFKDVTSAWGFAAGHGRNLGLAAQDMDDSGSESLYVANDSLPGDLWVRSGERFRDIGSASGAAYDEDGNVQAGMGVDWDDYDSSGRPSLIVTTFQDQPDALYHNDGRNHFHFASGTAGIALATTRRLSFGAAFADFDNDGWPDLLIANGHVQDTVNRFRPPATYAQPSQLFRNTGHGTFEELLPDTESGLARPIVGRGLAIGDYDNDGRPDALIVDAEGRPLLLHNESRSGHWLGIRLIGTRCTRDAIGARVIVDAGGHRQRREVQTGRSYLSASDPRLLFGLGTATAVRSATVYWPDGSVQHVRAVKVDRYTTIREP